MEGKEGGVLLSARIRKENRIVETWQCEMNASCVRRRGILCSARLETRNNGASGDAEQRSVWRRGTTERLETRNNGTSGDAEQRGVFTE